MLCSLWPTLINTAVGVTSVSSDLVNVSRVLRLNWLRHVRSIVLPSAVPMIFYRPAFIAGNRLDGFNRR